MRAIGANHRLYAVCLTQVKASRHMEPYLLVNRTESPLYDQHFIHRFYNKIVYSDLLVKNRYD